MGPKSLPLGTLLFCLVLAFHAVPSKHDRSVQNIEALLLKGISTFQDAYDRWDRKDFYKAHAIFEKVANIAPDSVSGYYWKGVSEFYILTQALYSTDKYKDPEIASEYLDAGIETFRKALEISDSCAECHALLATFYGIAISRNAFRAVTLGPRVQDHMDKALALDSDNPRIHYLAGMSYLFTPGFLGGGVDKAMEYLQKAEAFYSRETKEDLPPTAPRWGHSTALAFLGRAYEENDDEKLAVEYFRKALKVNPRDLIAKDGIKRLGSD